MEQALPSGGVLWRMLGAWADLRGSMRAELDRDPSEGRLLFYVMLSGLIWFIGRHAVLVYGPLGPVISEHEFLGRVGSEFVAAVFMLTLFYYGMAVLGGAIARAFGGTGDWRESRAATFWAALVAAPVILASELLSIIVAGLPGAIADTALTLGKVALGWALAQCIAEAHGFRSGLRVFIVIAGLVAIFVGAVYALRFL